MILPRMINHYSDVTDVCGAIIKCVTYVGDTSEISEHTIFLDSIK